MTGTYKPASGAGGKRPWRVVWQPEDNPARHRELVDANGNIVRFARYETALKRAKRLNETGPSEPERHPRYQYRMPA